MGATAPNVSIIVGPICPPLLPSASSAPFAFSIIPSFFKHLFCVQRLNVEEDVFTARDDRTVARPITSGVRSLLELRRCPDGQLFSEDF